MIIPAAGRGDRLGLGPKAFLELGGRTLLERVVASAGTLCNRIVAAVPPDRVQDARRLCPSAQIVPGDTTRQLTVRRLVAECADCDWIVIHDAARPLASAALFRAVLRAAQESGAAGAFLRATVPVARVAADGFVETAFEANEMAEFQAPQAFATRVLQDALRQADRHGWQSQSTMQLVLRAGHRVKVVAGEAANIKITHPDHWRLAVALIREYEAPA